MRVVGLLVLFAAAFGLAGLWQARRLRELRAQRELELKLQDGEIGRTQSGLIERGHAVVVVGRPSGAEPVATPASATPAVESATPAPTPMLSNFELTVQNGQTLSEIAKTHYGSASRELVGALAAYNHLPSVDALKVGAVLELPPLDKLPK